MFYITSQLITSQTTTSHHKVSHKQLCNTNLHKNKTRHLKVPVQKSFSRYETHIFKKMKNIKLNHKRRINKAKPMKNPKSGNKSKKTSNRAIEKEPKILPPESPKSKMRGRPRKQKNKSENMKSISLSDDNYKNVTERLENMSEHEFNALEYEYLKESVSIDKNEHLDTNNDKQFASHILGWVKKFIHQNVNSRFANIQKRFSAKNH